MRNDNAPPHSLDAEKAFISLILADNSVLDNPECQVSAAEFYSGNHQAIVMAACRCRAAGEAFDAVTAFDALADHPDATSLITEIMDVGYTRALMHNAPDYARLIRDHARRRRAIQQAERIREVASDPSAADDDLDAAIAAVGEDRQSGKAGAILASSLRGTLDPRSREQLRVHPIGEGFESVDLSPGKVVLLGAAPGTGKTALISQWTTDAMLADPTLRAFIANVEMSPAVLLDRQLARLSDVPLTAIRHRGPSLARVWGERLDHGLATLDGILDRLAFARNPHVIEDIRREARPHVPDILVLDYAQKMTTRDRRDSAREQVNEVMRQARQIADGGVCVIAVAAVSRQKGSAGSGYSGLTLASFRESGDLEFSADDCWVMEKIGESDRGSHDVRLRCLKARHGELTELDLAFDGHHQRFSVVDPNGVDEDGGDAEFVFDMAEAAY